MWSSPCGVLRRATNGGRNTTAEVFGAHVEYRNREVIPLLPMRISV